MTWAPGKQLFRAVDRRFVMVLDSLLCVLWPARCAACNTFVSEGVAFCEPCAATLDPIGDACPGCAMPVAQHGCPGCRRHPFPFAGARAAVAYGGAVTAALMRWKHGGNRHIGPVLAATFAPLVRRAVEEGAEVACPVPLHPYRLRQRGFNQALDLLRGARGRMPGTRGLEVVCDALERTVDTPSLGHASPALRREILAGAFRVARPTLVAGKHVLVADDVMTSGATFAECARVLVAAGARRVSVAALARAV
jgi:ComF family protein